MIGLMMLAAGGSLNNLVVQTAQIGGAWSELPATVDTAAKKVCATVDHLTLFALTARAPTALPTTGGAEVETTRWVVSAAVLAAIGLLVGWVVMRRRAA